MARQNGISSLLPKDLLMPPATYGLPLPPPHEGSHLPGFHHHRSILPGFVLFIDGTVQHKLFCVRLLFFTIFGRVIHFVVCSCVSFSLCCIVSHHMNTLQLMYPFYCSWTFGQFLVFAVTNDTALNIPERLYNVLFGNIINLI